MSRTKQELNDDLFERVQGDQGYFHLSDEEPVNTPEEFYRLIEVRLTHGRKAVRTMEKWLRLNRAAATEHDTARSRAK